MTDFAKFLEAADNALSVIKTVAETPGISALPYASTVSNAITAIRMAYDAGMSVAGYVEEFRSTFADGTPSGAQLDDLDARIAALRARLHAPMPPREAGEPE